MCWHSTSSAPVRASAVSCAPAAAASKAARHSSTSKRLEGTSRAREGSSSRWLARPMRWVSRLDPFGAPTLTTRSTSPQSMPRSSVEVHTTALSRPAAIASSTRRRWLASSEPWWRAIGRPSSFKSHSAWKVNSAWARVLTKTSVMRGASNARRRPRRSRGARCGRPRAGALRCRAWRDRPARRAAPDQDGLARTPASRRRSAHQPAAQLVRVAHGG